MNALPPSLLTAAVVFALSWCGQAAAEDASKPLPLDHAEADGPDHRDTRFAQVAKAVQNGQVLAGKKSTEVPLTEQPAIANNELRQKTE